MTTQHEKDVQAAADLIRENLDGLAPRIAIVLGSGLGGLADKVENPVVIPYGKLPGFPIPTVAGHAGELVAGKLNGTDVILLKGRTHMYETHDPAPMKTMIRAVKMAGVQTLFLSNAAGSLNPDIRPGDLMLIRDHIGNNVMNPLIGPNDDAFGARFVPMTDAWDQTLRDRMKTVAAKHSIKLHEGVYIYFRGPTFETPAEILDAQKRGADAVAMSVVPECIIARHCDLKVVGVSCITNMGAGLSDEKISHAHTIAGAARVAGAFERLVTAAVPALAAP